MSNEVCFKVPNVPGHEFLMMKPDDLAALVRDARRFRKLSAQMFGCDHMIGMSRWKDDCLLVWGDGKSLAEIADALPEVEQP